MHRSKHHCIIEIKSIVLALAALAQWLRKRLLAPGPAQDSPPEASVQPAPAIIAPLY